MPSQLPMPTLGDFIRAFHRGVKGKRNAREDGVSGSAYDYIAGTTSMLMARESAFIRDLFQAIYFDDAVGQDLTDLVAGRYMINRILDGYGQGFATIRRPNASGDTGVAAGARVFFEGTRIIIQSPTNGGTMYAVAQDTPIPLGALTIAGVPIRATSYGIGTAIDTTITGQLATFDDPVWDPAWTVTSVRCANGTVFETAHDFRARVLATLAANIPGYETAIVNACVNAGATNVAIFGTNFGGADLHSCATYVGDAGFNGTAALVRGAKFALESVRMLGAEMLFGQMVNTPLPISATISLYDDPSKFDTATITTAAVGAIRRVLGASGSFGYDIDAIFGAIVEISDAIQDVQFITPTSSVGLLVPYPPPSGVLWFPRTLPRYQIPTNGISLTYKGPS